MSDIILQEYMDAIILLLGGGFVVLIYLIDLIIYRSIRKKSELYKRIVKVNEKYKFYTDVKSLENIREVLNSKRKLDNYSFENKMLSYMDVNYDDYTKIFKKIDENKKLYNAYLKEYKNIKKSTKEEAKQNKCRLPYFVIKIYEKRIKKRYERKPPVTSMTIKMTANYTSPAGRNSYTRSVEVTYEKIKLYHKRINNIREEEIEQEVQKQLAKEKAAERKRIYNENLKKMKDLDKREAELKRKEEEFNNATKGHIYSSNVKQQEEVEIIEDSDDSWYKLTLLKKAYENGEISAEDYEKQRNQLLED